MKAIKSISDITTKIQQLYPNAEILGHSEIHYEGVGWIKSKSLFTGYTSPEQVVDHYNWLLNMKADTVQFVIKDEFGETRYPDYKLKEFIA